MSVTASGVLVDTNVWIAFFRGEEGDEASRPAVAVLDRLLVEDRVLLSGVVEMELLQGVGERERRRLEPLLDPLPYVEAERQDFRRAGEILEELRRRGVTIPAPDGLIAAQCLRRGLLLLENDRHFARIESLQRFGWRENP